MRRLIVISGAGLSVESGIRAFRTDTGSGKALWDEYDLEEVCNIHAFNSNFYWKTHEFYNKRRQELQTVEPNLAHLRIGEWFNRYPGQVINLTTNVDDLLERAGVPKDDTLYIHGYLKEVVVKDAFTQRTTIEDVGFNAINPDSYDWVKPNVVFFGEVAPAYTEMYSILDTLTTQDMVVVVGCSNTVINFNWELFPACKRGVKVSVVNPSVPYHEMEMYEGNGVAVYRAGAVETFSNKHFIERVEAHLEERPYVTSK